MRNFFFKDGKDRSLLSSLFCLKERGDSSQGDHQTGSLVQAGRGGSVLVGAGDGRSGSRTGTGAGRGRARGGGGGRVRDTSDGTVHGRESDVLLTIRVGIVHAGRDRHGLPGGLELGQVGNGGIDRVLVQLVLEGDVACGIVVGIGDPTSKGGIDLIHGAGSTGGHHPVVGIII